MDYAHTDTVSILARYWKYRICYY